MASISKRYLVTKNIGPLALLNTITAYAKRVEAQLTFDEKITDENGLYLFLSPFCAVRDDTPDLFLLHEDDLKKGKLVVFRDEVDYFNFDVILGGGKVLKEFFEAKNHYEWAQANRDLKVTKLNYRYNRLPLLDDWGEPRHSSFVINYSQGAEAPGLLDVIKKDLDLWRPPFKYKENVALMVDGCGLGDVTECEPVARFAMEELYHDANFVIVTDKPELFEHLPVPIYGNKDKVPEAGNYYKMFCFGDVESPKQGRYLSHSQCHCTDFCSFMAYRRQIPVPRKEIHLSDFTSSLSPEDREYLSNAILVHPGRHWPSKTFPPEVWESYVEGLVEAGYKIALIGKDLGSDQGVVHFHLKDAVRPRVKDYTNQMSLKQLIAAHQISPAVLSNDSAPLHIAGAFDNWIFAILTCKQWEYVMPYRHGSQEYKALALNKGYLYETKRHRPNQLDGFKIDKYDRIEDLLGILPSKEEVVQAVSARIKIL